MAIVFEPSDPGEDAILFLTERHLATLTTTSPLSGIQVTPVGFTYDASTCLARVITWAASQKARNIATKPGSQVALCQVDGGRWLTLTGTATATTDADAVEEAVRRYGDRYREPASRDDRVVLEVVVKRIIGRV